MPAIRRRGLTSLVVLLTAFSPLALFASPAAAFPKGDSVFNFKYKVVATTHIAKSNQTLTAPPGIFKGGIDLDTGQLAGSINLPPSVYTQSEAGIGLVTITAATEQVKPVSGKVNFTNFKVTSTSVFNIHIVSMVPAAPAGLPISPPPVNLVGPHCITATPVHVTMSGIAHLGAPSTFKGTFSIPDFKNCQAATTLLNQEVPGGGNTFAATATPA